MNRMLEICCDSISSVINAQKGGADRIELCENLAQGGVTPSLGKIKIALQVVDIPIFVLIRPRKSDFLYSEQEFAIMLKDIEAVKATGAHGIVSGILMADGTFDYERMQAMVEASAPLPFTCHRAFDMCRNPEEAITQLAQIGVKRILTSGQQPSALEGLNNLAQFASKAMGKISIMACGHLLPDNIAQIKAINGITEFHSAPNHTVRSEMTYRGITPMGDETTDLEFQWEEVSETLVRGMQTVLQQ